MTNTQAAYLDFDAGDGSLYEHGEDGQILHLFTADPACELDTFEEFTAKAQKIVNAVNYHDELVGLLQELLGDEADDEVILGQGFARRIRAALKKAGAA